jgi:hypothetical protein
MEKNSKTPSNDQTGRTKVKLKKSHTHAGVERREGDEIEITDAQATVLTERGVI